LHNCKTKFTEFIRNSIDECITRTYACIVNKLSSMPHAYTIASLSRWRRLQISG